MNDKRLFTESLAQRIVERTEKEGPQKYRPSNGSEGEMFMERWCWTCQNDDYQAGKHCPIISATMAFERDDENYPEEWTYSEDGQPCCTAYERDWSKS